MPIYEYDTPQGPVVALMPVAGRDNAPPGWKRRTVPSRVAVMTGVRESTVEDRARAGLRSLEEQHGSGVFEREMGWTGKQLKEIWKD